MILRKETFMANEDYNPCQCDGAGFCKRYGNVVTETMYNKCKRSAHYRQAFERFFIEDMAQSERNEEYYKQKIENDKKKQFLDEVIQEVEKEGIDAANEEVQEAGLGTVLANVFSKFGITEEKMEEWSGMGGCGCSKRKKFLNKILPFKKTL